MVLHNRVALRATHNPASLLNHSINETHWLTSFVVDERWIIPASTYREKLRVFHLEVFDGLPKDNRILITSIVLFVQWREVNLDYGVQCLFPVWV